MTTEKGTKRIHNIPLEKIDEPLYFLEREDDLEAVSELAHSMKEIGLINPVTVIKLFDNYRVVTGAHRVLAARALEWETIPSIIIKCKKEKELTLTLAENINRTDLNPFTIAYLLSEIQEAEGLSIVELAQRFGKSEAWVSNKLLLFTADEDIQLKVATGEIGETSTVEVLRIQDKEVQRQALDKIEAYGMSVQATREMVKDYRETGTLEPERLAQEEMIRQEETPELFMAECAVDHHAVPIAEVVVVRLCKEHYEMIRKMLQVQQLDFFRL